MREVRPDCVGLTTRTSAPAPLPRKLGNGDQRHALARAARELKPTHRPFQQDVPTEKPPLRTFPEQNANCDYLLTLDKRVSMFGPANENGRKCLNYLKTTL